MDKSAPHEGELLDLTLELFCILNCTGRLWMSHTGNVCQLHIYLRHACYLVCDLWVMITVVGR